MELEPGARLGAYEIVGPLGRGGMGEVYRARDTRLEREVAVKMLPEELATDPERQARFEREARVLAALSHPNVATVHGFEQARPNGNEGEPLSFLVMELVDGEDLATRLERGPLPNDEAIELFRQVAAGLEAAHNKGIVHRDLKPANIMVDAEGRARLLDFGLARSDGEMTEGDLSQSPTMTARATGTGVLMGTAAYMSPEQARGQAVDKRTDIWAYGCSLYEALTGQKAFEGGDPVAVMAAILRDDPDWNALPRETPASVSRLLRRCLRKKRNERLRDVGDAWMELAEVEETAAPGHHPVGGAPSMLPWLLAAAATLVAALSLASLLFRSSLTDSPVVRRLSINLPTDLFFASVSNLRRYTLAVSRDGERIAYIGIHDRGPHLFLRELDRAEIGPLTGTEGAYSPVFSPDGRWVSFTAAGQLKTISLETGQVETVCPALVNGDWTEDGRLLFTPGPGEGIAAVSVAAGEPLPLTELRNDETFHVHPQLLPGDKAMLLTVATAPTIEASTVGVFDLETRVFTEIEREATRAHYLPTGHLVYSKSGQLIARPFDLERLQATGPGVLISEEQMVQPGAVPREYGFSEDGLLVFAAPLPGELEKQLVPIDMNGPGEAISVSGAYQGVELSPDGRYAALEGAATPLTIVDLTRGANQLLPLPRSSNSPTWRPGSELIDYLTLNSAAGRVIQSRRANGTGFPETLLSLTAGSELTPESWSPTAPILLLQTGMSPRIRKLYKYEVGTSTEPELLLTQSHDQSEPTFSNDGRWIAYEATLTRPEIYLRPFPDVEADRIQVTVDGGEEPRWARASSNNALFFRRGSAIYRVAIDLLATPPKPGEAERFFEHPDIRPPVFWMRSWDVSPDGESIVLLKTVRSTTAPDPPRAELFVVENWFEEIEQRTRTD